MVQNKQCRHWMVAGLSIILLTLLTCSISFALKSQRIKGGVPADVETLNGVVALVNPGQNTYFGQFGAGALIHPNWVVTSAQNVLFDNSAVLKPIKDIEVVSGIYSLLAEDGERIKVKRIIIHPEYDPITKHADIALLELVSPAQSSTAVISSTPLAVAEQTATVFGWGLSDSDNFPSILQQVDLPVVAQADAVSFFQEISLTETMLFAGYKDNSNGPCKYDSGAPLFVDVDGTSLLVGIFSWNSGCDSVDGYSAFTNILSVNDFIESNVTGSEYTTEFPTDDTADTEMNWWDATPEEEISSPYYDSILYSELAPTLHKISEDSDRVNVSVIGQSVGGRNLFLATISDSNDDQGKYGYYKEIRKLMRTNPAKAQALLDSKKIKVPVFINCSIHGNEYPGTDAGIRLIRYLAYYDSPQIKEILANTVILVNVIQNPDGRVLGQRYNAAGIDINRDFVTMSQPESQATISVVREWNPMVFLDLHGFVNPMLIEPCTPPHMPNSEYDIFIKWALSQAKAMESALMEATGFEAVIPYRDWPQEAAWDDWAPSYAGVYSILPGAYGHTLETPYRDERGVDAHFAAVMGALNFIIENKNEMLNDQIEIYRRGVASELQKPILDAFLAETKHEQYNEITVGDFPTAYVIPAEAPLQKDPHACAKMIDYLLTHGVDVTRSTESFEVEGTVFPTGTYIVWMNQPKRGLANTILEDGHDLSAIEGGLIFYSPPVSWSVPLLWGVSQTIVRSDLVVETANVYRAEAPEISLTIAEDIKAAAWLPENLDAYKATGDLLYNKGISVMRAKKSFSASFMNGEKILPVGTFIISLSDAIEHYDLLANTYQLNLYGLPQIPDNALALSPKAIAITYDPAMIYCLNQLNIPFESITNDDYELEGDPNNYDLFINSLLYWPVDPEDPGAGYKPELNKEGQVLLNTFLAAEKDYIGYLDAGISLPIDAGAIDVQWQTDKEGDGIISMKYNAMEPVSAGFTGNDYAYIHSPIWFTGLNTDSKSVANIAEDNFFISGYWPQKETAGAAGMPIVIHSENKDQDMVLIGIDPVFRCHPKATFKLIGNAIYSSQE